MGAEGAQRLSGVRALVTGGGSGIGAATVERLAREGASVVAADVDLSAAKRIAQETPGDVHAFELDVRKSISFAAAVDYAKQTLGSLTALVNNAGVGLAGTVVDASDEDFDLMIDVNVRGTFNGMRAAIPSLIAAGGGSVVNIASIAAVAGVPNRAIYSATKGAVLALTRAAAIDHASDGVRVNCIIAGTADTPWVVRITRSQADPSAARAAMEQRQVHGRLVKPSELAAGVAYLLDPDAGSLIGSALTIDGGMTAR